MKPRTDSPASPSDPISPKLNTGWNASPFLPLHLKFISLSFCVSARLWNWVHGKDWLLFTCEYLMLFRDLISVCLIFAAWWLSDMLYMLYVVLTTKSKVNLGFRLYFMLNSLVWRKFMLYSLVWLSAAFCEEAIFIPEVGFSIWQLNQEYMCTWIWTQLPLHRVQQTLLLYWTMFICKYVQLLFIISCIVCSLYR